MFSCGICNTSFRNKTSKYRHRKDFHRPPRLHFRPFCDDTWSKRKDTIIRHIKRRHPSEEYRPGIIQQFATFQITDNATVTSCTSTLEVTTTHGHDTSSPSYTEEHPPPNQIPSASSCDWGSDSQIRGAPVWPQRSQTPPALSSRPGDADEPEIMEDIVDALYLCAIQPPGRWWISRTDN